MPSSVYRALFAVVFVFSAFSPGPVNAVDDLKEVVKSGCGSAGGSYSSGSNYARCEYSNGDSYTCNTDVNKCESCTNGKCTVSITRPGAGGSPTGPGASVSPKSPALGKGSTPAIRNVPAKRAM